MITAVDTNVLLDLLVPGSPKGEPSERALTQALQAGTVIICELVYAELAARFPTQSGLDAFLTDTSLRLQPSNTAALHQGGRAWLTYTRQRSVQLACPACGTTQDVHCTLCGGSIRARQAVIADFLIAAHAQVHADRLLTRDRRYYATYFPRLRLLTS